MKYWSDFFDTYAAENLEDVKNEQIAAGLIEDGEWYSDEWIERSESTLVWVTPIDEIDGLDKKRMADDSEYKKSLKQAHCKTLEEIFNSPELRPSSITGKAWFMSTSDY